MKNLLRAPFSSIRIGRLFDVDLYLNLTVIYLATFFSVLLTNQSPHTPSVALYLFNFIKVISVFVTILLHEIGHVTMARWLGYPTNRITLYALGGYAEIPDFPIREAQKKFLITIAGPFVTFSIVLILFVLLRNVYEWESISAELALGLSVHGWVLYLFVTNIVLLVFNLLPVTPMDGGRVFESVLHMWLGRRRAAVIASTTGLILTIPLLWFFIWSGGYTGILLMVFLASMNRAEYRHNLRDIAEEEIAEEKKWLYEEYERQFKVPYPFKDRL